GYMNKITSSRKLEKTTQTNIELMWLLRRLTPDDRSICEFRKNNKDAINKAFKYFVSLLNEWNLFGKEVVAVDGSLGQVFKTAPLLMLVKFHICLVNNPSFNPFNIFLH
ncbi:Transposase domain, partial [Anaerovirgula multivorans]